MNKYSFDRIRYIGCLLVSFILLGAFQQTQQPKKVEAAEVVTVAPIIKAKAALVADETSGQVLLSQNGDERLPIASMTKIITAYLVLDAIHEGTIQWDDVVPISPYAHRLSQNYNLSNVPLSEVESYTVRQLMETVMVYSSNSSAVALAEYLAGTEADFVKKMGALLENWGITDYQLFNASGLTNSLLGEYKVTSLPDDAENEMRARDLALVGKHIIDDYPEILELASLDNVQFRADSITTLTMTSFNHMLPQHEFYYEGVDGLKTGTTEGAGAAFIGTVKRGDTRLISVVIGAKESGLRFSETARLYDYIFEAYEPMRVMKKDALIDNKTFKIVKGRQSEVKLAYGDAVKLLLPKGMTHLENMDVRVKPANTLEMEEDKIVAPIKKGQIIGKAQIRYDNELGYLSEDNGGTTVEIKAAEEVKEANIIARYLHDLWRKFK
ncbi:D-alanyl-D-alanine carboxypeptidase family protein [Atopobacter phocae]|uniref:D-alanyl-D-alanine carboxypeptidase family protein n=1 Tax=Atopobacter phocae TaxID=136492 RepID=UPI00046F4C30|nr:D-alanyl-D-alanine carboxypeptidase family protein [Atopobacter phocae]